MQNIKLSLIKKNRKKKKDNEEELWSSRLSRKVKTRNRTTKNNSFRSNN